MIPGLGRVPLALEASQLFHIYRLRLSLRPGPSAQQAPASIKTVASSISEEEQAGYRRSPTRLKIDVEPTISIPAASQPI